MWRRTEAGILNLLSLNVIIKFSKLQYFSEGMSVNYVNIIRGLENLHRILHNEEKPYKWGEKGGGKKSLKNAWHNLWMFPNAAKYKIRYMVFTLKQTFPTKLDIQI